jgi:hypothetical protein
MHSFTCVFIGAENLSVKFSVFIILYIGYPGVVSTLPGFAQEKFYYIVQEKPQISSGKIIKRKNTKKKIIIKRKNTNFQYSLIYLCYQLYPVYPNLILYPYYIRIPGVWRRLPGNRYIK